MRLGVSAALVDGTLIDGDVTIDGDSVTAVGVSGAGGRGVAVPGFVDVHINGIAGVDFLTADGDGHARAAEALAAAGVVAYQPTLVSSPPDAYDAPLAAAAAAMAAPAAAERACWAFTSRDRSCPRSGPGRTTRRTCASPTLSLPTGCARPGR